MNAKTTRILKEARSLFWPWCAVIIAGVLPLVGQSHSALIAGPLWGVHYLIEPISLFGFFLGIPLLATLSLGNEFQHRTLSLLLSQPVDRMEIWGEKLSVTIVATLSATLVFPVSWRAALHQDPVLGMAAGAWIIAMIASATFWTLIARSTLGGLVLTGGVHYFFVIAWLFRRDWIPETMTARSVAVLAFVCYTGVMLWLGRRTLARFQVTGGMAGEDLLMAGSNVMPGAMAGWFRYRPTGAVLNLIHKEVRLLRPVWLISLLGLLGWICLSMFGFTLVRGSTPALIMVMAFTPLIAVLAGSLALGEERSSGMYSWHLTQPVSALRQWLIKLFMALVAGLVCAAFLPILVLIAGGFLSGSPFRFVDVHAGMVWVLMVLLLSFASFWCACAVNGTVRAILWVFPVMLSITLAPEFGDWVARKLMGPFLARFDLFANFRFTNAVSNIHWFATGSPHQLFVVLWLAPTLLLAVIQSYRLFRIQLQGNTLFVFRYFMPLVSVAFLCFFSVAALDALARQADQQMWTLFHETHEAIEGIQPGTANLDAAHPLELTVEDLAKAGPLSERTQRWLHNSRISVTPDKLHHFGQYRGYARIISFAPEKAYSWYLATIRLPNGSDCTVRFQAGRGFGILGGVCK